MDLLGNRSGADGGLAAVIFVRRGSQTQQTLITGDGTNAIGIYSRLLAVPVLLIEDLSRLFRGFQPRQLWVSELALGVLLLCSCGAFGITRGAAFLSVAARNHLVPDLPEAFDGFTITQITDVHSGSFTNAAGVQKGLDLVNDQQSDVILFTGDLVNNRASEMDQWIPASQAEGPDGQVFYPGQP